MNIPFTEQQFFGLFSAYNRAVWPAQIFMYLAGLSLVLIVLRRRSRSTDRIVCALLSLFWIWMGSLYHLLFFSSINPAARVFGILFILQGLLFALTGMRGGLDFGFSGGVRAIFGAVLMVYSLLVYPLLGIVSGHGLLNGPQFGVAPCPTVIFTFGILLMAGKKVPLYLVIIPLLWSLVGISAAVNFGVTEDLGLPVAALFGTVLLYFRPRVNRLREAD